MFLVLYLLSRAGVFVLQSCLSHIIPAPSKHPTTPLTLEDWVFILINTGTETIFIQHALEFCSGLTGPSSDLAYWGASGLGSLLLVYLDDMVYTVYHYILHKSPVLFMEVHRHHHNIRAPTRGYLDAVNEHPLEMAGALALTWMIMQVCRDILTPAAVVLFVTLKAICAIVNHMGRSVVLFGGLLYSSTRHADHHRLLYKHFGQI